MAQVTAAGPAAAQRDTIALAHDELLQRRDLQFEFTPFERPEVPGWLTWLGELLSMIAPLLRVLFIAGLAAIGAFLLFLIVREIWRRVGRHGRTEGAAAAPQWQPQATRARALLADADRLAAEGRYAEAVHLLLFRSLDDIEAWRPRLLKPALTARDIAALDVMPHAARLAFSHIAQVVERSFFGGADVDAAQYRACRNAYAGFALQEGTA